MKLLLEKGAGLDSKDKRGPNAVIVGCNERARGEWSVQKLLQKHEMIRRDFVHQSLGSHFYPTAGCIVTFRVGHAYGKPLKPVMVVGEREMLVLGSR